MVTLTSCQQALNLIPSLSSGVYTLTSNAVPTWCEFENGNGWALIMKMSGFQTTFSWASSLWTNQVAYNTSAVYAGLDTSEYKSSLYWQLPFSFVRVGFLGSRSNNVISWASFPFSASSLHACIADGVTRLIPLDRNAWKNLVGGGSLQLNCNRSGFNVQSDGAYDTKARLGILGNEQNECNSPDSRIGFGAQGTNCGMDNTNSVGNECICGGDNGEIHYKAYGFIMVR
jgi:hypothetical protein